MKSVLFATYIASALLLSATARADIAFQTQAQVEKVTIDPSTQTLSIYGTLANPCTKALTTMTQNVEDPRLLTVSVAALSPHGICIAMIQEYKEELTLMDLASRSPVEIDPNQVYLVNVLNFEFEYQVSGADLLMYQTPGMQVLK